ncbi:uncharacterized protein LOC124361395 [Homalodisca vitripennis]|uniref:uncharacterized protein LOC124361395 n=1 Tax=Homalodisca vitripennis TaxID=197043 RepID=UPI001EEAFCC8|nr:uncharacterized protein LOC124361395 [Homalodisca vitripennis]
MTPPNSEDLYLGKSHAAGISTMVQTTRAAKYRGVLVDNKLTWRDQIFRTADKASKMVTHLSRLMANVGGPKSSRRRLLMSTVQFVLLYGAEVWADALNIEFYRIRTARVHRQAVLRVCSAYRTVSETAVLVIAGVIPVKLLEGALSYVPAMAKQLATKHPWTLDYQTYQTNPTVGRKAAWRGRLLPHNVV